MLTRLMTCIFCLSFSSLTFSQEDGAEIESAPIRSSVGHIEKLQNEISRLKDDIQTLESNYAQLQIKLFEDQTQHFNEYKEIFVKLGELEAELSGQAMELKVDLSGQLMELKSELSHVESATNANKDRTQEQEDLLELVSARLERLVSQTQQLDQGFSDRSRVLLELNREVEGIGVRLNQSSAQVEESQKQVRDALAKIDARLFALDSSHTEIRKQYLRSEEERKFKEQDLSNRIGSAEEINQKLSQSFRVFEDTIARLRDEMIADIERLGVTEQQVSEGLIRIAQLEATSLIVEELAVRLDLVEKADIQRDEHLDQLSADIDSIVYWRLGVSEDFENMKSDLLAHEGLIEELEILIRRIADVSELNGRDMSVFRKRLDELEFIQMELGEKQALKDKVDEVAYKQTFIDEERKMIQVLLDKIDRLESTINPSEQQFLKDRVDEIYYKQTSLSNEEDRLDALEGKIRKLEKRLGQIVPDSNSAEEELEAKPAE